MLDEFRSTLITWDKATSRIYSPVTANESDENGRKLVVQIVNSGQVEDLTGATLHLYWETRNKAHDGLDVFKAVDLKKGEFELSYTTGMLSNQGVLNANLVLIDSVGRVVSERFKITVTEGIDDDAIQSENSFSSLTQALIDVGPRLNDLTAQLQQTEQQKADRNEVRLKSIGININDLDEPTRQTFLEAQGIDVNYVLGMRNVKPENTDFLQEKYEVNKIPLAKEVSSIEALQSSTENSILKGYKHNGPNPISQDNGFDLLKIFVKPGDVVRSKLFTRSEPTTSSAFLFYIMGFRSDGTKVRLDFETDARPSANGETIRENGWTAPSLSVYAYVNIRSNYYLEGNVLQTNGKKAEVVTINEDKSYTEFDQLNPLDDYESYGHSYYKPEKPLIIERYENSLGNIQKVLASLVEVK